MNPNTRKLSYINQSKIPCSFYRYTPHFCSRAFSEVRQKFCSSNLQTKGAVGRGQRLVYREGHIFQAFKNTYVYVYKHLGSRKQIPLIGSGEGGGVCTTCDESRGMLLIMCCSFCNPSLILCSCLMRTDLGNSVTFALEAEETWRLGKTGTTLP